MQINFKPSFGYNNFYNEGYSHGKKDGIEGHITQTKETNDDYQKGYNAGYIAGKEKSNRGYATVDDVIQELVVKGMTPKDAVEFVAQYLGGW